MLCILDILLYTSIQFILSNKSTKDIPFQEKKKSSKDIKFCHTSLVNHRKCYCKRQALNVSGGVGLDLIFSLPKWQPIFITIRFHYKINQNKIPL